MCMKGEVGEGFLEETISGQSLLLLHLGPGLGLGAVSQVGEAVMDTRQPDASLPAWARALHSWWVPLGRQELFDRSMRLASQGLLPAHLLHRSDIVKGYYLICQF